MGLDNYWLVPKDSEENLEKFEGSKDTITSSFWDGTAPQDVEFDTAEYCGEYPLNLVGGMLSSNGNGSFRGKYYSPLCDALLGEDGWLYCFRYTDEIQDAYNQMQFHLALFQGADGQDHFQKFVEESKNSVEDGYGFFSEYTLEDAIGFIKMFEYYHTVENICLGAWY